MIAFWTAVLTLAGSPTLAQADPCIVDDDGTGTVTLPPPGCAYLTGTEVHEIIDGLPAGTTIELAPIHQNFICEVVGCGMAGGSLGGEAEFFNSTLVFQLTGTGTLAGFNRVLSIPALVTTHTAPRTPGDPVQTFATDMFSLGGSLPPGDPDFTSLQIVAGTNAGLPSPGSTTLTDRGDGTFQIDSFFDITYTIDFEGAPGGALEGFSGTTTGTVRMEARGERDPCVVADDGTGTVELPPPGCEYLSRREVHKIIDGLPPGTTIELSPRHRAFFCPPNGECGDGDPTDGDQESFTSQLVLQLQGTGELANWRRTLRLPTQVVTRTQPRNLNELIQSFETEMVNIQGNLFGDPDFAELRIGAGAANGLPPSPGHTTLTDLGDGTFQVDSFFDITYQIDFVGAPGGALDGLSGSTQGRATVHAQNARDEAVEPDNGTGTVTLPPRGSSYVSPRDLHMIIDGLPPRTQIEIDPKHWRFFCDTSPCGRPGGTLGGEVELFQSTLDFEMTGTGSLAGFNRRLQVPVSVETHTAPRLGNTNQSFSTDMHRLQGGLFGDPDFDELVITAGTGNSLPSPGHTTLTNLGNGTFQVDSFFDISYRIDFVGSPTGALQGMGGSTEGTARVTAFAEPFFTDGFESGDVTAWSRSVGSAP